MLSDPLHRRRNKSFTTRPRTFPRRNIEVEGASTSLRAGTQCLRNQVGGSAGLASSRIVPRQPKNSSAGWCEALERVRHKQNTGKISKRVSVAEGDSAALFHAQIEDPELPAPHASEYVPDAVVVAEFAVFVPESDSCGPIGTSGSPSRTTQSYARPAFRRRWR
jgi:hypothetical protein